MFICRSTTRYVFSRRVVPRLLDWETIDTEVNPPPEPFVQKTDLPRRSNIILSALPSSLDSHPSRLSIPRGIGSLSEYESILKIFSIYVKFSAVQSIYSLSKQFIPNSCGTNHKEYRDLCERFDFVDRIFSTSGVEFEFAEY